MKFITLTSARDGVPIHLNVAHIGDVHSAGSYTIVGTTCHNNGGFRVRESVEKVLQLILN